VKLVLGPNESILWESRPVYPLRYPLLSIISFLGITVISLGSFWIAVAVFSFFLLLPIFAIASIAAYTNRERTHYYITTEKILNRTEELRLDHLSSGKISQSSLNRIRKIGNVYFETIAGSSIIFKRVKDPEMVKNTAVNAKAKLPAMSALAMPSTPGKPEEIVIREVLVKCPYCGATSPQGTTTCPSCGGSL
jgi:hypothetical protein